MSSESILVYANKLSVAPGDELDVMISADTGCDWVDVSVERLICLDSSPGAPGFKTRPVVFLPIERVPARRQPLAGGSYAVIPDIMLAGPFSFTAMIWPSGPNGLAQTIGAWWTALGRIGFVLERAPDGTLRAMLGDGEGGIAELRSDHALRPQRWYAVALTFDAESGLARLQSIPCRPMVGDDRRGHAESRTALRSIVESRHALTMAAHVDEGGHTGHFNGKIDRPRLWAMALSPEDVQRIAADPDGVDTSAILGCWDFAADMSSPRVHDTSGHGNTGIVVNLPARAVTGWNWTGVEHDWRRVPEQYGAIHFHDDDLYDAGWHPSCRLTLPRDFRSGCYIVHLKSGAAEEWLPFFVRPAPGQPTAPVAFLASTATYIAYANMHGIDQANTNELKRGRVESYSDEDLFLDSHRELGLSTYDTHSDGSGVYYSSWLRPILNMRPAARFWSYGADTHITDWLEARGQDFDVVTDEDLHAEGEALLNRYRTVITGTHPEYFSRAMLDAVSGYLAQGGRLQYLGGNGFYWRTSFSEAFPGAIEVRKTEGSRSYETAPGERHHSFDGALGGTWRQLGRAPQQLVGVGFCVETTARSGFFVRTPQSRDPRAAFIFEGVEHDTIGRCGSLGGAAGLECDRADEALGTPPHALVVATSRGLSGYAIIVPEEVVYTNTAMDAHTNPNVRGDIVFFETRSGGAVFSVGSINWASALSAEDYASDVARIAANVLARFLDERPFLLEAFP